MKVILISGKAEAGKTLSANIMKDYFIEHGKTAIIIPYARSLKDLAKLIFDWDGKKDENGRKILQYLGTDHMRNKAPDYWVMQMILTAFACEDFFDYLIIDDCRFKNEIDVWHEDLPLHYFENAWSVRINRPGYQNRLTPEQREHISECDLDDYEFDFIVNACLKEELKEELLTKVIPHIEAPIQFLKEETK